MYVCMYVCKCRATNATRGAATDLCATIKLPLVPASQKKYRLRRKRFIIGFIKTKVIENNEKNNKPSGIQKTERFHGIGLEIFFY